MGVFEWDELEEAAGRGDWCRASALADDLVGELRAIRLFVLAVAMAADHDSPTEVEVVANRLAHALAIRPVDEAALEDAMGRLRRFLP